ncbi:fungal-specific transcription factor domain-containing protein [Xylariaceae sp. FL0255]|nr:fungal-specific transcription factor domain-containing protein [Xylariaceae sp. FL0255]
MESLSPAVSTTNESTPISCERCRRRKIRCDRKQPSCSKCTRANVECRRVAEKQRPTPKAYVQALESQVASLETFIHKLASSNDEHRHQMLSEFMRVVAPTLIEEPPNGSSSTSATLAVNGDTPGEIDRLSPSRAGQFRKTSATSSKFYGDTSLYNIPTSDGPPASPPSVTDNISLDVDTTGEGLTEILFAQSLWNTYPVQFAPHDDVSQRLMAAFFKYQYMYIMCIYREFFLRDYDTGGGRHYSDALLFAICATGALATNEPLLSDIFMNQAESLLYPSLNSPDLTVIQALMLLGQLEIGRARASKGWLFCGMAFRLAHEMGLHLDPTNWSHTEEEPDVELEILRRVYWAAFIVDKQLSLFFGRPPAMYPQVSDVKYTVRIPYPNDWQNLFDTYIEPDTSITAFEDGICLVNALVFRIELYRIMHGMITEVFENRRTKADSTVVAATITKIHVSLTKWLANLPNQLNWNQWTLGQLPPYIYHLHLLFHTVMTILHRPPSQHFRKCESDTGSLNHDDIEICYESLGAIMRLLRSYARFYSFNHLPLNFVQTLSTAASTILMRRHINKLPWNDVETARSLDFIVQIMEEIQSAWPCVGEILNSIRKARQTETQTLPDVDPVMDFDFLATTHHPTIADAEGALWPSSFGNMLTGSMLPWNFAELGSGDTEEFNE